MLGCQLVSSHQKLGHRLAPPQAPDSRRPWCSQSFRFQISCSISKIEVRAAQTRVVTTMEAKFRTYWLPVQQMRERVGEMSA